MFNLTRQQQQFLCVLMLLLAVGWMVKTWRAAHPVKTSPAANGQMSTADR